MSEEINAVIEKLCEKIGTSTQFLIPELTKLNIITDIYTIIMCIIIAAVLAAVVVWGIKNRKDEFDTFHEVPAVIAFICCVAAVMSTIAVGCDLIRWLVSPTASAVLEIVNMLK